jgi:hypothetical protein
MEQLIHATYKDKWPNIEKYGIEPKDCIYFTTKLPNSGEIIPGMDKECNVFIYLTEEVFKKHVFVKFENEYITRQRIDPKYFKTVLFTS